jgi:hypothetical protein
VLELYFAYAAEVQLVQKGAPVFHLPHQSKKQKRERPFEWRLWRLQQRLAHDNLQQLVKKSLEFQSLKLVSLLQE